MSGRRAIALRERASGEIAASLDSYRATNLDRARPIVRDGSGQRHADDRSRQLARELARDQDRSSGIYRAMVTAFIDMAIGSGVMPRPTTADPAWNAKALRLVLAEFDQLDVEGVDTYSGLQRKWARAIVNDGDQLLVKTKAGKLVTIEADRIDGRPSGLNQYRRVAGGVLLDGRTGERIAYGVCPYDGSGSFVQTTSAQWYPADQVIYTGTSSRKSQVRSLPALVANLDDAERADSLIEAEIITAEQASMIWGFLKDNSGAGAAGGRDPLAEPNLDGSPAFGGRADTGRVKFLDFVAGTLGMIGNREFQQAPVAKPNLNVVEFLRSLFRIFAAELGVPYELALLDVGKLSWSANKALLAFCERRLGVWRGQVFGPLFSAIYRWRVRAWIAAGLLADRDDWSAHEHDWPRPPETDGPDQVTTDKGNLELGKTSLRRLVGAAWKSVLAEQAEEQQVRDALALDRIEAIERRLQELRKDLPGLQSLSWAHVITLGGAITAPGAYLAAAVGKPGEAAPADAPPKTTKPTASPAGDDDKTGDTPADGEGGDDDEAAR